MNAEQALALERSLRSQPVPAWLPAELAPEFLLPDYSGRSLANVPATLAALLGAQLPGCAPALQQPYWAGLASGTKRVIVVLLDALGYLQLNSVLKRRPNCLWARLAQQGVLLPMTSVVPSTTTTALITLGTGTEPIAHGMLGYELWLREYGVLTEMLSLVPVYGVGRETLLDWGLVPESFIPTPGLGTLLGEQGVHTTAFVPAQYVRSALSRMIYRGVGQMQGYYGSADMWAQVRHTLVHETAERSCYFVYWGNIDTIIHRRGSGGGIWQAELQSVTQACEAHLLAGLTPQQREGTLLVLLADHGFVDTPVEGAHDTEADTLLLSELAMPYSGEARLSYLHLFGGANDGALQRVREILEPDFLVCRSEEIVESGLLGRATPIPEARARLGQLFVAARGDHYLDRQGKRLRLRGRHGGLSPEEMLIPWLATRLDA